MMSTGRKEQCCRTTVVCACLLRLLLRVPLFGNVSPLPPRQAPDAATAQPRFFPWGLDICQPSLVRAKGSTSIVRRISLVERDKVAVEIYHRAPTDRGDRGLQWDGIIFRYK